MEVSNSSAEIWTPPSNMDSSWVDLLNDLLEGDATTSSFVGAETENGTSLDDQSLFGFLFDGFEGVDNCIGPGMGLESGERTEIPTSTAPSATFLNHVDYPELCNGFIIEESLSLPSLSTEESSIADHESPHMDSDKLSGDVPDIRQDRGVSSPQSCNGAEGLCTPPSNLEDVGNVSCHSKSPIANSCGPLKAASPDTDSYSSDVGAMGNSCDNFVHESGKSGNSIPDAVDEDCKRQSRLMRNRESATQSRLRKKEYIKELEAKCRMMENQMSLLHQTVALTSAQNAALREELAHVKLFSSNGLKSGVKEPAVLPSDSLPSESPSRLTFPFLLVKWQLVAFLCHVLLLTPLQAVRLKLATSGESAPSKARSSGSFERFGTVANRAMMNGLHYFRRRRKRTITSIESVLNVSSSSRWKKRIVTLLEDFWLATHRIPRSCILKLRPHPSKSFRLRERSFMGKKWPKYFSARSQCSSPLKLSGWVRRPPIYRSSLESSERVRRLDIWRKPSQMVCNCN